MFKEHNDWEFVYLADVHKRINSILSMAYGLLAGCLADYLANVDKT